MSSFSSFSIRAPRPQSSIHVSSDELARIAAQSGKSTRRNRATYEEEHRVSSPNLTQSPGDEYRALKRLKPEATPSSSREGSTTPTPQPMDWVSSTHSSSSEKALEEHRNTKAQEAYQEIYNKNRNLKAEFLKKPELLDLLSQKAPYFNPHLSIDAQIRAQIRASLDKNKEYYVMPFLKNSKHTEGLPKVEHEEFMKQVLTQVIHDWIGDAHHLFRS